MFKLVVSIIKIYEFEAIVFFPIYFFHFSDAIPIRLFESPNKLKNLKQRHMFYFVIFMLFWWESIVATMTRRITPQLESLRSYSRTRKSNKDKIGRYRPKTNRKRRVVTLKRTLQKNAPADSASREPNEEPPRPSDEPPSKEQFLHFLDLIPANESKDKPIINEETTEKRKTRSHVSK